MSPPPTRPLPLSSQFLSTTITLRRHLAHNHFRTYSARLPFFCPFLLFTAHGPQQSASRLLPLPLGPHSPRRLPSLPLTPPPSRGPLPPSTQGTFFTKSLTPSKNSLSLPPSLLPPPAIPPTDPRQASRVQQPHSRSFPRFRRGDNTQSLACGEFTAFSDVSADLH